MPGKRQRAFLTIAKLFVYAFLYCSLLLFTARAFSTEQEEDRTPIDYEAIFEHQLQLLRNLRTSIVELQAAQQAALRQSTKSAEQSRKALSLYRRQEMLLKRLREHLWMQTQLSMALSNKLNISLELQKQAETEAERIDNVRSRERLNAGLVGFGAGVAATLLGGLLLVIFG